MFSSRLPSDLTPNRLTAAVEHQRAVHRPFIDLTRSNPTRSGFEYGADLLVPLAHPRGLVYEPHPLGLSVAREAVAADFSRRGVQVSPERIALTASTSEAYAVLFTVLCEPGDEVLVPRPSYPLFEHLTRLNALRAVPYELEYQGSWSVDLDALAHAVSPRTRVLLAVSPNNPTGSYLKRHELEAIDEVCSRHGFALVVDEVFADYSLAGDGGPPANPLASASALTFCLGGLSKSVGLPQLKLAWLAAGGAAALADEAMRRIEFVCDAYLSVATPVQAAAGELLERGRVIRSAIHHRVASNYRQLCALVAAQPSCQVLTAEGGWYGVVQVPSLSTEDDLVVALLTDRGVLVHPGYFFDFARESFLVVSLLAPEAEFVDGIGAVVRHFDCTAGSP